MSIQSSRSISASNTTILDNAHHYVSVPLKVTKANLTLTNGVLPKGTIISSTGVSSNTAGTGANAYGIVLNDVDFTNAGLTEVIPVLIHGVVRSSALPSAPVTEAKTALKNIIFV